jgi:hypothetical protein
MNIQQATEQVTVSIQDTHTWRATYHDGSFLDETHAVGGFASVDLPCVKTLLLQPLQGIGEAHCVDIPAGATPVFFRRRSVAFSLVDESSEQRPTVHCIGWKKGEEAVYLFIMDDGSTLLTEELQAV